MIITIDGFCCQGKSYFGKKISEKLGVDHLSTGLIFRLVVWEYSRLLRENYDVSADTILEKALYRLDKTELSALISMKELKEPDTEKYLKEVSSYHSNILPRLQKRLFEYVQDKSMVLDGRFTFQIFPEAKKKYYFKSSIEDRANLLSVKKSIPFEEAITYIRYRDSIEETLQIPDDVKIINPFLFTEETLMDYLMQDIENWGNFYEKL